MTQDPYEQPAAPGAEGAVPTGPPQPAPMGPRVGAAVIDIVILIVVSGILSGIFGTGGTAPVLLSLIVTFGYFIGLEAANDGKTVGKMALGLRAVTEDGQPLTWGTSAGRNILRIIDGLFIYLVGFIIAMTNDRRQRLGDMVAKTIVIRG